MTINTSMSTVMIINTATEPRIAMLIVINTAMSMSINTCIHMIMVPTAKLMIISMVQVNHMVHMTMFMETMKQTRMKTTHINAR